MEKLRITLISATALMLAGCSSEPEANPIEKMNTFVCKTSGIMQDDAGNIAIPGEIVCITSTTSGGYTSWRIDPLALAQLIIIVPFSIIAQGTNTFKTNTPLVNEHHIPEWVHQDEKRHPGWLVSNSPTDATTSLKTIYSVDSYRLAKDPKTGLEEHQVYQAQSVIRVNSWHVVGLGEPLPAGFKPAPAEFYKANPKLAAGDLLLTNFQPPERQMTE